jgi:hypothetical protein
MTDFGRHGSVTYDLVPPLETQTGHASVWVNKIVFSVSLSGWLRALGTRVDTGNVQWLEAYSLPQADEARAILGAKERPW